VLTACELKGECDQSVSKKKGPELQEQAQMRDSEEVQVVKLKIQIM
jgi:hypothetical protein